MLTTVTTTFADREPQIAELMRNVQFTNDQMQGLLSWQEANGASAEETAVYFLTTQQDVWSGWISSDARSRLSAILN